MKICVVGFGHIGSVIAAVLASRGYEVVAVDTNESMVAEINDGHCSVPEPGIDDLVGEQVRAGRLTGTTDISAAADCGMVFVTVGTPLSEEFDADLSHVRKVFGALSEHVRDGQMIVIKSTVPPGVTRMMAEEFVLPKAKAHMAFSPERLAEGRAIQEFLELPIVVGGIDDEATAKVSAFWREALDVEVLEVATAETAELVKLADNLWIDVNIALANELAKLSDALPMPIDVLDVIRGANSLKKGQHYVNILTPSNGVGGYCLTKDPWFVDALGKRHGVDLLVPSAARNANDSMPGYTFDRLDGFLKEKGVAPADARIAVLGYSFKTDSGDCRLTPVAPFMQALRENGYGDVRVCDPTIRRRDFDEPGFALVDSPAEAIDGADAVAIMAGHGPFRALSAADFKAAMKDGALILDGRMYYDRPSRDAFDDAGLTYLGIGR